MAQLTEEQKQQQQKRNTRNAKIANADGAGYAPASGEAISLPAMLGLGNEVIIGGQVYEVAAFPISKLSQASVLVAGCPDMLTTMAVTANGDDLDAAGVSEAINRLMQQVKGESDGVSEEAVAYSLSSLAFQVTDENVAAMTGLTVLALSRRHPGITVEDIADDLDIETFFGVMVQIFRVNTALKKRF